LITKSIDFFGIIAHQYMVSNKLAWLAAHKLYEEAIHAFGTQG
jgi:hypothetical protein